MICWKPTKFITLTTQGDQDVCICNCHLPCLLASLPLILSLLLPQPSGIGHRLQAIWGCFLIKLVIPNVCYGLPREQ